ncbi:telomeric repeat-binding factor 2-interacting protein 1-like isoform X2 [Actinia tenebrosa]|nr:telomeric repeat-binding factor 2-interacting protein 1-like isoform X2 [Actinia tenebrosa]
MVFVIIPGDTKKRLRPVVENGGGVITSKETPGAIRLVEPNYKTGKQLVSSDFVFDSYKRGTLCNIEDYRIETKPDIIASPGKIHITVKTEAAQNGRMKYSPEEDQAILDYIRKFEGQDVKLSGNKIWQEMENKKVTCRRWQSMRSRYLSFLRQSTCSTSHKGKLEFIESKNISKSQITIDDNSAENALPNKKIKTSCHFFQKDVTVNEKRKDKENVRASLPKEQKTCFESNCDEIIQQTYKTSSIQKNKVVNTLDKSESQDVEAEDLHVTCTCTSSFVDKSSNACCNKRLQTDDTGFCATCRKNNSPKRNSIEGTINSCNSEIRKLKAQPKDISSRKVESGKEHFDVPQYDMLCNHDNENSTDDCSPVLRCHQLFENFKQIEMISQKSPCKTQTPTPVQVLHALYVSCGCLKCASHYLQTGLLLNGQEIWKREEDLAISSGDAVAIKKIVDKRGQKAVDSRKQFLSSF